MTKGKITRTSLGNYLHRIRFEACMEEAISYRQAKIVGLQVRHDKIINTDSGIVRAYNE